MADTRIERDCLGEMEIPNDRYYGIQTTRMKKVSGAAHLPIVFYPDIFRAMAHIKKAAARANASVGALDPEIAEAIAEAADKTLDGSYDKEFPLDFWQGGGYTCLNMNVNEVLGNMANEILTGHKGQDKVHPNTHVNMGQSTNDTIPSATHLAIVPRIDALIGELRTLAKAFEKKSAEFADVVKVGRTCWQDALPLTVGQEFSGYASVVNRLIKKLERVRPDCLEIVMGGSAVGTGLSGAPGYKDAFYKFISEDLGETVTPMDNLFDGFQNSDTVVTVSGIVKEVACTLSKFAKDLRLMSSGPRAGWMELELPALSPGSSIMPGKINPTVPEMVIQIAHQVIGNDVAVSVALYDGELDLNVWDSTFYKCLFESFTLVEEETKIFCRDCVEGIKANRERCMKEARGSIAISTIVATCFGYPTGVKVAHYCEQHGCDVHQAVQEMGLMTKEEADWLVDPILMTEPEKIADAAAEFKKKHAA